MTYDEANNRLVHCDSYSKMDEILRLAKDYWGPSELWLRILGECWSGCDNIFAYKNILKNLMPQEGPVLEMMSDDELAVYETLPDTVTIYRGCGKKNKNGASWSLDRDVAAKFPFLNRYQVDNPMLVTAKVKKCHVLAVKLCRNESEVITFNAKPVKVEPLNDSIKDVIKKYAAETTATIQ